MRRKVVITGATGSLGQALCKRYVESGFDVVAVSRQKHPKITAPNPSESKNETKMHLTWNTNQQRTCADAQKLLDLEADVYILCAGAIESEIDDKGLPYSESVSEISSINYVFPSLVIVEAAGKSLTKKTEVVTIGSIADGSPSCFGPVYHASKAALRHFVSGIAPIAESANSNLRIRMYRPGVIKGPLSWAPVNRLSKAAHKVRARRCESAPEPEVVASRVIRFIEKTPNRQIGSDFEPISFQILKFLSSGFPNFYVKIQHLAWKKASRFSKA